MRIVMRLAGGLGNQLFQYAAGRAAADAIGAELLLDGGAFGRDRVGRRYALDRFGIEATRQDLAGWRRTVADWPGLWRFARATGWAPRVGGTRFLFDRLRGYDPRLRQADRFTIATGYWQDERHFADRRERLLGELESDARFPDSAGADADLRAIDTVVVHVRRGDFTASASPHGTCGPEYYRRAIAWQATAATLRRVVVFSDDPAAAAALVRSVAPAEAAVEIHADRSLGDDGELRRMSRCRRLVIANSSYSWWAAWLADRGGLQPGTLIACPGRWYLPAAGPIPHPAPERWHRIATD